MNADVAVVQASAKKNQGVSPAASHNPYGTSCAACLVRNPTWKTNQKRRIVATGCAKAQSMPK